MSFTKFLLTLVLGIIGVVLAIKIIGALLGWALNAFFALAVPVVLVLGVLYIIYRVTDRKAIGGRDRSILP